MCPDELTMNAQLTVRSMTEYGSVRSEVEILNATRSACTTRQMGGSMRAAPSTLALQG